MYLDFWAAIALNHFITEFCKKELHLVEKNNIQAASSGRILAVAEICKVFIWLAEGLQGL